MEQRQRKESVDRNTQIIENGAALVRSLYARRVWIEIPALSASGPSTFVALRKESVDRNYPPEKPLEIGEKSLSARRAWIEMQKG